jgi:putative nucleotidyltransferase with HDIG domain
MLTLSQVRLLHVEDDPMDARLFGMMLNELDVPAGAVRQVGSLDAALDVLRVEVVDVVFLDLDLPDSGGLATIERLLATDVDVPVVVLTGHQDEALGVLAIELGAQDYLVKDHVHAAVLGRVLRYAVVRQGVLRQKRRESARAAATAAREAAVREASERLEHETVERQVAQSRLALSLARLRALSGADAPAIADLPDDQQLGATLDAIVPLISVDVAVFSLLQGDRLVAAASRGSERFEGLTAPLPVADPAVCTARREQHATFAVEPGSAGSSPLARADAMRRGDLRTYHVFSLSVGDRHLGILELYAHTPTDGRRPDWVPFVETHCVRLAHAIDTRALRSRLVTANTEIQGAYDGAIEGWARALDLRDHETMGHSRRVTELALELARRLGLDEGELDDLRRGALLHDIGKIAVPDAILRKQGSLDEAERSVMERHTEFARDLLEPIPFLRSAIDIPYAHHERWDGHGYPRGLMGEEIPLAARIFAVADVYDALTYDRPYRRAWSVAQARAYIAEGAGTHFDPDVVAAFLDG